MVSPDLFAYDVYYSSRPSDQWSHPFSCKLVLPLVSRNLNHLLRHGTVPRGGSAVSTVRLIDRYLHG